MTTLDDRLTVFRLAALVEDLSRAEAAAMRREAERLESEANKLTGMNLSRVLERGGLLDLFREWADLSQGEQVHARRPQYERRHVRRIESLAAAQAGRPQP